ncbi:hypothetical protein A4A49_27199 [Nicotiana attenuata]|uniref:Uncharacterized protein n=1 Tax=Nicotiana attenuata TaxID=49451 RepID=A0A314KIZ2_NICAT|nr:hypothetical protein A4A49_27199 [Nicotiana attenuata]
MNSYINVRDFNSPYQYNSPSLHWCFHCPSSTNWVTTNVATKIPWTSLPPPPHLYHQQYFAVPSPPNPTFPPAVLEKIYTSIKTTHDLVIELQHMQEMQLDSTTLADTTTEEAIMDDELDSVALVGVNESDFDLVDETSKAPDPQSLVIKVGDTFPELEGFRVLHIAPVITYSKVDFIQAAVLGFQEPGLGIVSFNSPLEFRLHFERPRVAYNQFDQMPKSNGLYRYWMMPKNMTAQHMLLHFPFDPGSANGLVSEGVALVFDNSLLWNLLYSMFGEMLAIGMGDRAGVSADQVFDGNSQKNNHIFSCLQTRSRF